MHLPQFQSTDVLSLTQHLHIRRPIPQLLLKGHSSGTDEAIQQHQLSVKATILSTTTPS